MVNMIKNVDQFSDRKAISKTFYLILLNKKHQFYDGDNMRDNDKVLKEKVAVSI